MRTFDRILVVKRNFQSNQNDLYWLFVFVEGPTNINFDILVSSFGPIQDMDMVCCLREEKI